MVKTTNSQKRAVGETPKHKKTLSDNSYELIAHAESKQILLGFLN